MCITDSLCCTVRLAQYCISTILQPKKNNKKIKMWYMYTMEYYSATKKNEILPFVAIWMDLKT